jgi:hypothetical protein
VTAQLLIADLIDAEQTLIDALDAQDVAAIENAILDVRDTVSALGNNGAWAPDPETCDQLLRAANLARAAQIRVRMLSESVMTSLSLIQSLKRGEAAARGYSSSGRITLAH